MAENEPYASIQRKLGTYSLTVEDIELIGPEFLKTITEEEYGLLVKDLESASKDPKIQYAAGQMLHQREVEKKRKAQQERIKKKLKRKKDHR